MWGDAVINTQSMWICCPHKNTRGAFLDFSTLRPDFKKVCLQALRLQDQVDVPKRCKTCAFTHKSISMWMALKAQVEDVRDLPTELVYTDL